MKERRIDGNVFVYNALISGFCEQRKIREAHQLFDEISQRNLVPTHVTYNTLIDGYCKTGLLEEALKLKERMKLKYVPPNQERKVETAENILNKLIENGFSPIEDGDSGPKPSAVTYNTLIKRFYESSNMEEAEKWLQKMGNKGVARSVETYNIVIDGYSNNHMVDKCLEMLERYMVGRGVQPNTQIYNMIIAAQCNARDLQAAFGLFGEMLNNNVVPSIITYNSLINGQCKKGKLEEAEDLLPQITDRGLVPDAITYNPLIHGIPLKADTYSILIGGHCKLKDFDGAYAWYREMVEQGFLLPASIGDELINGFKEEGRLEEV
ncbi:hypothetical protein RDABS01_023115 [Bienertia sinuspersici]